jgi:hypothetical protein
MPIVNLENAIDLHIHSNPSLFTRAGSDIDIARHAAEHKLTAVLFKNHFESTVGRAYLTDQVVEGVRVFGGLVLNQFSGGINPIAVETSINLGAKQIWMPTVDALGHIRTFGHAGGYGYQESGTRIPHEAITILDGSGKMSEETKVIVELVIEHQVMLGTGHLSREEIFKLAEFCSGVKFDRLVITHPYFDPPKLSVADQVQLAQMGAMIELCGGNLYPIPGTARLSDYLESIASVGVQSLVLSSDAGQPRKSTPAEVLRVFAQCLMEKGVTQEQIDIMTKTNPAKLLGI